MMQPCRSPATGAGPPPRLAADETAAKELLLSLMPQIEQADRDDLLLEVLAQLGEIYLVRTLRRRAKARRIRDVPAAHPTDWHRRARSAVAERRPPTSTT